MPSEMKKCKRKHWLKYNGGATSYGNWCVTFDGKKYYGFGVYLMNGSDAWLDFESSTETERKDYKAYCKEIGRAHV